MPSISITRTHELSHRKAREAAEKVARDLKKRFELDYALDGDEVTFERPGVTGLSHGVSARVPEPAPAVQATAGAGKES